MSNTNTPLKTSDRIIYRIVNIYMFIMLSIALLLGFMLKSIEIVIFAIFIGIFHIWNMKRLYQKPLKTWLKETKGQYSTLWNTLALFLTVGICLGISIGAGILVGIVLYAIGWTVRALLKPWWGV